MSEPERPEKLPEELLGELPEELRAFESELRRFTPTPPTLDLADLMFRAGQAVGQATGQAAGQTAGQAAAWVATNRAGNDSAEFVSSGPSEAKIQLPNRGPSLVMMSRPVSGWWRVATAMSLSLAAVLAMTLGIIASRQPGVAQREPVPDAPSPPAGMVVAAAPQSPTQPAPSSSDIPRLDRLAAPAEKSRLLERSQSFPSRSLAVQDVVAMLDDAATQDGQFERDAAHELAAQPSDIPPSYASPSSNASPSNASGRGIKNLSRQELIQLYLREVDSAAP